MDKNNLILSYVTDDDIDQILSLMLQNMDVLFLDDVVDSLCNDILIFKLIKNEVIKCPFCGNSRIGVKDLVSHIQQEHRVEGIYYDNIQIIPHSLDNIDPRHPPSKLQLCGHCGFPTSDAYGSNSTSDMIRHIEKACKETTGIPQIKSRIIDESELIQKYLTDKNPIDAKCCRKCEKIIEREEPTITHYVYNHCELEKLEIDTVKKIFNNPSGNLFGNLSTFDNLVNERKEYITHNRISVASCIRKKLDKRQDFVAFSNSWLLNSKLLSVDINKIAEELDKFPEGLSTANLTGLVFDAKDTNSQPTQRFSLCYALQQNGNFLYDFERDIWKFKPALIEDSPEEEEILESKRMNVVRIRSKIKLGDEEAQPSFAKDEENEIDLATWQRIKKDEISYLLFFTYIYNGFLPYDKKARGFFSPNVKRIYFITDSGEKFTVKIDKYRRAVYSRYLKIFFQDIPAGTIVYLRRLNSDRAYKIYFKKMPQTIKDCRMVKYDPIKKTIIYEIKDLEVLYECVPPVFKAELRFKDLKALQKEAKLSGFSISDLVYLEFKELAKIGAGKAFHFNDIYNRVFFRRMCSPGGVWSILKRHPSYYKYIEEKKLWEFVGAINGDEMRPRNEPTRKNNKIFIYIILILMFLILFFKFIPIKR